jgi:hypothetical protein
MPNPKPKLENLRPFKPKADAAMTGRLYVRVPASIETAVKTLPSSERSEWLRRIITEAAQRELLHQEGNEYPKSQKTLSS